MADAPAPLIREAIARASRNDISVPKLESPSRSRRSKAAYVVIALALIAGISIWAAVRARGKTRLAPMMTRAIATFEATRPPSDRLVDPPKPSPPRPKPIVHRPAPRSDVLAPRPKGPTPHVVGPKHPAPVPSPSLVGPNRPQSPVKKPLPAPGPTTLNRKPSGPTPHPTPGPRPRIDKQAEAQQPIPGPSRKQRPSPLASIVMFRLDTIPSGAKVTQRGRLLGYTPLQVQVTRGNDTSEFVFQKAGYRRASVVLANSSDALRTLTLERQRRRPAPKRHKKDPKLDKDDVKRLYDAYKKYRHWF